MYFASGSARLTKVGRQTIAQLAQDKRADGVFVIVPSTDPSGLSTVNKRLARSRAQAVISELLQTPNSPKFIYVAQSPMALKPLNQLDATAKIVGDPEPLDKFAKSRRVLIGWVPQNESVAFVSTHSVMYTH